MRHRKPRLPLVRPFSPGYTLIELLIVVMIAILLMVVSLPVAKTVMDDARPREAARILNTGLFTAKARAASSGRLVGMEFVLQRMNDPGAAQGAHQCTQMYMCEVPAMYMGDTTDARATVNGSAITFLNNCAGSLPSLLDPNTNNAFEIRFNHRGLWYSARYTGSVYQINTLGLPLPSIGPNGSSFHIRRPPVRVGNPIELPKSTCIDMVYSGVGPGGTEFGTADGNGPLRIMFAPAGNLHSMSMSAPPSGGGSSVNQATAAFGTVHFLVGKTGRINLAQEGSTYNFHDPEKSNLADGRSLWVSVSRNSGIITTNENNPDLQNLSDPSNATQRATFFTTSRKFATNREQKGGL